MANRGQPNIEGIQNTMREQEEYRQLDRYGQVFSVPRWRMVIETGHGYEELTDEEKRLAREYICTDQAPAIIESFRKAGEEMGRRHAERVEAAVMRAIGGGNG